MKLPNDTTNSARPDSGGDAAEALSKLAYQRPQISILSLAAVVLGGGGTSIDDAYPVADQKK